MRSQMTLLEKRKNGAKAIQAEVHVDSLGNAGPQVQEHLLRKGMAALLAAFTVTTTAAATLHPTIVSPAAGQVISVPGAVDSVSAIVKVAGPAASMVQLYEGKTLLADGKAPSSGGSVAMIWRTTPGLHTITAKVTTAAGQSASSPPVTFTLNRIPHVELPSLTRIPLRMRADATTGKAEPVAVHILAYDRDGSITQVQLFNGGALLGIAAPVRSTSTGPTTHWVVEWPNPAPGTYKLIARATDNLGATAQTDATIVTIGGTEADADQPKIYGEAPRDVRIGSRTPYLRARFAGNGIDTTKTKIMVDRQDVTAEAKLSSGFLAWRPSNPLAEGVHQIRVETADSIGRTVSKEWQFTVVAPASPNMPAIGGGGQAAMVRTSPR